MEFGAAKTKMADYADANRALHGKLVGRIVIRHRREMKMRPRMEFGAAKAKMADYADANRALHAKLVGWAKRSVPTTLPDTAGHVAMHSRLALRNRTASTGDPGTRRPIRRRPARPSATARCAPRCGSIPPLAPPRRTPSTTRRNRLAAPLSIRTGRRRRLHDR